MGVARLPTKYLPPSAIHLLTIALDASKDVFLKSYRHRPILNERMLQRSIYFTFLAVEGFLTHSPYRVCPTGLLLLISTRYITAVTDFCNDRLE